MQIDKLVDLIDELVEEQFMMTVFGMSAKVNTDYFINLLGSEEYKWLFCPYSARKHISSGLVDDKVTQ